MNEEKVLRVWVGALIENSNNKFLFLKRSKNSSWEPGRWQLPGGMMEWGEKPLETLAREVTEETGIDNLKGVGLLDTFTEQLIANGKNYHMLEMLYLAKADGDVRLSHEHDDAKGLSIE